MCRRYGVNNAFILSISNKSQDEKVSISGKKADIYIYLTTNNSSYFKSNIKIN